MSAVVQGPAAQDRLRVHGPRPTDALPPPPVVHRASRLRHPVAFAAAPLVASALGLAHPQRLTADTASRWLLLHVVMLFVFPLIAVGPIVIVSNVVVPIPARRLLIRSATTAAALFAVCYSTLDVLAGIGAGALVHEGLAMGENDPQIVALQQVAEPFGTVGSAALVCCIAIAGTMSWKMLGRRAAMGSLLAVTGAWGLGEQHVYWPLGTLVMLCLGAGLWMLSRKLLGAETQLQ